MTVQSKQKRRYDDRHQQVSYTVGEWVLVYRPLRKKGRSEKLLHRFHGPFIVVRKLNDLNYVVRLSGKKKKEIDTVHVSRMKRFNIRKPSPVALPQPQPRVVSDSATNPANVMDPTDVSEGVTILRDEPIAVIPGGEGVVEARSDHSWSHAHDQDHEMAGLRDEATEPIPGGGRSRRGNSTRSRSHSGQLECNPGQAEPTRLRRVRKAPNRLNL